MRGGAIRRWMVRFAIALLAGMTPGASGQAAHSAAPAVPGYSVVEKQFAAELSALPLEDGLKDVASADVSRLTAGVCLALKEDADNVGVKDPQRAVEIFRVSEALAARAGLPILAANDRFNQAVYLSALNETYEEKTAYDQALEMYMAAGAPEKSIADVHLNRAAANLEMGDMQAAIADDDVALRTYTKLGDEVGVASTETGLGNAYRDLGSFSEAEAAFSEALRIARAHGEKLGESLVLNNMSEIHAALGDYAMAIRFCEQSLEIKRRVGSKADVVTSLTNLARFYHIVKRDNDASRALNEAAQIGQELNSNVIAAKVKAEMGAIQLDNHQPEAALKLLLEGYGLIHDAENRPDWASMLVTIAEADFELKNYEQALKFSKEAAAVARYGGMLDQLAAGDRIEAEVDIAENRLMAARNVLEESIGAIEQMRSNVSGGADTRKRFMAARIDPYRLRTEVAGMEGDWAEALDSSEKGKGRILLDLYTGNDLNTSTLLSDAERAEETRLRSRFLSLDSQVEPRARLSKFDLAKKNELDGKLQKAKNELSSFREQLYEVHPELRLRRADFSSLTRMDVQALVAGNGTALLEYELTPAGNYLIVVTKGKAGDAEIHGYKLTTETTELARHVRRYHEQLATRDPEFAAESRWLYAALLEPAKEQLAGATCMVIVPDGVLWQVPFQSLQRADGRFLIETTAVDYVPSLGVLRALKNSLAKRPAVRTLLAMGDPDGATQDQADEARALQNLYGSQNARVFIGPGATLNEFRHMSAQFDVVHLAAHGIYDDRDPMSSHMLLASDHGHPEAGWLRARDIQTMQLRAELVVLSGCETGKGQFEDGEGLVGMSWAALAAGAHSSLASAWRVEASSTTEMMIAFHDGMLHGMGKAEALRRAELRLLHSGRYGHPFYWAAFVLMGDGVS